MKITQEVRAIAMERAQRRCECTGGECGHHRRGARCTRGLRGDQWKVYWRREDGGATRDNIEAWCLECFARNFDIPRETVTLLAPNLVEYADLLETDHRKAVTMKSVLRDAAVRAADGHGGRVVFGRIDDDLLMELPSSPEAVSAVQEICAGFTQIAERLNLPIPDFYGAIHRGEVTRWRNGTLVGEAVDITISIRELAGRGQVVLTQPAAEPLGRKVALEPLQGTGPIEPPTVGELWTLSL